MGANALFKDKSYSNVRFTYTRRDGSTDDIVDTNYSEGEGNRYYFSILGSTASDMEAATFKSFISVTMSGDLTHYINIVPLFTGETTYIRSKVVGVNLSSTKAIHAVIDAAFIHTSNNGIQSIGGPHTIDINLRNDFNHADVNLEEDNDNNSINLLLKGEVDDDLDWDIYVEYTKEFHSIVATQSQPSKPIYPPPPPQES